jgi:hypothetical protein
MVIKVKDPKRWMRLPAGEVISLEGETVRPVRLEVNALADASFQVRYADDSVVFLAAVKGMEVIEFIADGPLEVWVTSEEDVYFYTDDGRNVAFVDDGQVSFTKPHERRSENEQLVYMQGLMLKNMARRNAELEEWRAEVEAEEARVNNLPPAAPSVPSDPEQPPLDPPADGGAGGVVVPPDAP